MSTFDSDDLAAAQQHLQAGRLAEARAFLHAAIDADPGSFPANYMLGIVLAGLRDRRGAIAAFRQAASIDSNHAELQRNLGALLAGEGKAEAAAQHFRRATEIDPDDAQSQLYLGQAFQQLRRDDDAVVAFEAALVLQPSLGDARYRLALSEHRRGNEDRAATLYLELLTEQPDDIEAALRLSDILYRRGAFADAIRMLETLTAERPDHAEGRRRLGMGYRFAGRKADAAAQYRTAVALKPDHVDAQMELGELLLELRDPAGAVECFRRALATRPDHAQALHRLYFGLASFCQWDEAARLVPAIDKLTGQALEAGRLPIEPPFLNLIHCDDPARNRAIAEAWGRALAVPPSETVAGGPPQPVAGRRLRVGYLSYDFRNHAVAQLTCRMFELHDRSGFEIFAYSYGPDDGSALRRRVEAAVEHFTDIGGDDYAGAARRIAADGIDVLVDLAGHTMNSRLKIMAYRPAPVQVTWLGYPGTSGCPFVDYLITDRIVTPPRHADHYTEKLCLLPDSFQPNDDRQAISPQPVTRRDYGLPADAPVFCSFNRPYKIEPVMFDVWMTILGSLPGSVLWLHEGPQALIDNLRREAASRGVDGERIVFADRPDKALHLRRLALADLALDTRIYNGHTTTSDALWAGVPVVTMLGQHFASRVSASALHALGLPELVASDLDRYRDLAVRFGGDRAANAALRAKLQRCRSTMPLYDSARFTRHIEKAYRAMLHARIDGAAPGPIGIPA